MKIANRRFQIVDFRMRIGINGKWKFETEKRVVP
jgi:hypothetical protein